MDVENIGVAIVIQDIKTKKVLLVEEEKTSVKSDKKQGEMSIVVGRIVEGESLFEAIQREVYEETGLRGVKPDNLIMIYHFKKGDVVFLFSALVKNVDVKRGKWYSLDEVKNLDSLRTGVFEAILDFEKGRRHKLDIIKTN